MSMEQPPVSSGQEKGQRTPESQESQPALKRIAELRAKSQFERVMGENSPATKIRNKEGKEFSISTVESGNDPALDEVQALFERTFGEDEVDPIETMKFAVDGVTESGEEDTPYRVVPIHNEKQELVGTFAGAPLEMLDEDGNETGHSVYFVGYAVTDPSVRQAGLAREAYISALMDAVEQADKQKQKLSFSIGECTATSEHYWNSVGWKRVYVKDPNTEEHIEVPYIQPALDFNRETGDPTMSEVPEHLMIDSFSGSPSKNDIASAYMALIEYNAFLPREEFESDAAFEKKEAYIKNITDTFKAALESEGELVLLDAKTREEMREKGAKILDHDVPGADDPENERF
jgi:hypothetical protein